MAPMLGLEVLLEEVTGIEVEVPRPPLEVDDAYEALEVDAGQSPVSFLPLLIESVATPFVYS